MKKILFVIEILVLVFFLFWHWKLGMTRLFDADEFAHLHWGYSFSIGERPYTDFFYLFPPFFLFPIAAIFKIIGREAIALLYARMFIFSVFLATSGVLFLLSKKLRNIQFGLFAVIIFAFLPLPFDKFIEIRPDIVAAFLALAGLLFFINGTDNCHSRPASKCGVNSSGNLYGSPIKSGMTGKFAISLDKGSKWYFLSGLSYAASLAFVPKTIFFLVPVGLVLVVSYLRNLSILSHLRKEKKRGLHFILGFVPVGLLLLLVVSSFGNLSMSLYSMTRMASEVTKVLGSKFYMRPDIFFYPNDFYYGLGGWSVPLIINLVIYISASVWAIHRLVSLGTSTIGGVPPTSAKLWRATSPSVSLVISEFLMVGTFFANLGAFVLFYPLKHAQYLIPVAPFIAFYFTDMLWAIKNSFPKLKRPHEFWKLAGEVFLGLIIILFVIVGGQMNRKKMQWGNKATLDKVNYFLKTIPSGEAVYDLTGESVFFKNGYYFCCLPYGQYEEALFFNIPDIDKDMIRRGTKYVHLGWRKRLDEIPARHASFIRENFVPITGNGLLWEKKRDK